jgi:DNA invertase Pin-like site-specific DNA recombinase
MARLSSRVSGQTLTVEQARKNRRRSRLVAVAPTPVNAILLVRISFARDYLDEQGVRITDTEGVNLQIKMGTEYADRLGWVIGKVVPENDVSAFKRKKVLRADGRYELRTIRPDWQGALDDLLSGANDGLLVVALDRSVRDPRDLEDLIDVAESKEPRIPVESVTGSLRLNNDSDVTHARNMVSYGNLASRETRRRVRDRRAEQAESGQFGGGGRPYGFGVATGLKTANGFPAYDVTQQVPAEAAEIARSCEAILAGNTSVRELLADMRTRGKDKGVTGVAMTAATWRDILCRPRNAGLAVYRGEVLEDVVLEGVDEEHPPIVPVETWRAVVAVLTDPHRRTSPGPAARWLGTGIYLCGHPDCLGRDVTMRSGRGGKKRTFAYLCTSGTVHLARNAEPVDEHVQALMVGWFVNPKSAALLTPQVRVDTAALNTELNAINARIIEAGNLWEAGVFGGAELAKRRGRLDAQLTEIKAKLAAASEVDPLAKLAANPNAGQVWSELSLAAKRAIMRRVVRVTILPSTPGMPPGYVRGSGLPYLKPNTVRVEWVAPA